MVFAAAFQASAPLFSRSTIPPSSVDCAASCAGLNGPALSLPPCCCVTPVLSGVHHLHHHHHHPQPQRSCCDRQQQQRRSSLSTTALFGFPPSSSSSSSRETDGKDLGDDGREDRKRNESMLSAEYLRSEIKRVEEMEEILEELEYYYRESSGDLEIDDDEDDDDNGVMIWTEESLSDIFGDIADEDDDDDDFDDEFGDFDYEELESYDYYNVEDDDEERTDIEKKSTSESTGQRTSDDAATEEESERKDMVVKESSVAILEQALLQGVVPVSANVGSDELPGDFGFDPLNLATKDYFAKTQQFLLNLIPEREDPLFPKQQQQQQQQQQQPLQQTRRPKALILRDYREAEIRHGRLAMLAAIFWPLQEMLDQLLLDEDLAGPLIYGPVTLPYFPLFMTLIMLLLGYLDIYSQAIKDRDSIGEAFLPGDCFWDPLRILEGAPDSMKRNMQERELFNGRVAMIAFAVFTWEEAFTHLPLNEIEGNELLLRPLYEVPYVQEWLDNQFSSSEPPETTGVMDSWGASSTLRDFLQEGVEDTLESLE